MPPFVVTEIFKKYFINLKLDNGIFNGSGHIEGLIQHIVTAIDNMCIY